MTYAYDSTDRLASLTDTAGGSTSYTYTAFDEVKVATGPEGTVTFGYDAVGNRVSTTNAGRSATSYSYDASGVMTKVARDFVAATMTYDAAGRRTSIDLPGGWNQSFAYDAVNQVTGITYSQGGATKGTLTYGYDGSGRRSAVGGTLAAVTQPPVRSGLAYDAANRLTTNGSATLTYDADGQLKNDGTTSYTWDARGRLSNLARSSFTSTFGYDATGARSRRSVNGSATGFLQDGANVSAEKSGSSVNAELLAGGVDEWFARTAGSSTEAVLSDALGSPIATGAADGSFTARWAYDPYGEASVTGDRRGSDLGFTGRQDDGTGLLYYRARYYSPGLGRFISEDPIGMAGGSNLYAYAAGAPDTFTDPTGNNPMIAGCLVGAGIDGGISYVTQRLSGRKVDWGWSGVGGAITAGCLMGAGGAWLAGGSWISRSCKILPNSFEADTPVLMSDGSRKRIDQVRVGDRVVASDGPTGQGGVREVTAVIKHGGEHRLIDVSLTDGTTITATDEHPFWLALQGGWVDAEDLVAGDVLATQTGEITVRSVASRTQDLIAYNLEVDGLHTYYAGDTPVLVHNACHRDVFFRANPGLKGTLWVHHAIERQILSKYPGLFTKAEIENIANLRGIPKSINSDVHLSKIRVLWNTFYKQNPNATRQEVIDYAEHVDDLLGRLFAPPVR